MERTHSPWIHQLSSRAVFPTLASPISADVGIIGGGIAGVTTAYFLLTQTKRSVVLFEASGITHGATGHNAGQLAQYFERPFYELVQEFGADLAAAAQRDIHEAFFNVQRIVQETKISARVDVVAGYAGLQDLASVERMALDILAQKAAGLPTEELLLTKDHPKLRSLSSDVRTCATWLPHKSILALLETKNPHYIGAVSGTKGCMNSAVFTEELLAYLLQTYPDRLAVFEHSPVHEVDVHKRKISLRIGKCRKRSFANAVVVCTNGFENITLQDAKGLALNRWFHRSVRGSVGYMAGYLEERNLPPAAVSFLPPQHVGHDAFAAEPYVYVTRRPFAYTQNTHTNLVCIGGPEMLLDDTTAYRPLHAYPKQATEQIQHFLQHTWKRSGRKKGFDFLWHGLMGYTPHGVRLAGRDPEYPHLFYNLGCNGVGLLTSVVGAKRVAQLLGGERLPPSIFDPAPDRDMHHISFGEHVFAYSLFAIGIVLGLCVGGLLSLSYLPL